MNYLTVLKLRSVRLNCRITCLIDLPPTTLSVPVEVCGAMITRILFILSSGEGCVLTALLILQNIRTLLPARDAIARNVYDCMFDVPITLVYGNCIHWCTDVSAGLTICA